MLFQEKFELTLLRHTRGIVSEDEVKNLLIDQLLRDEPFEFESIAVFLGVLPAEYRTHSRGTWHVVHVGDVDGQKVPIIIFGTPTEEDKEQIRNVMCRNADVIRKHFGLGS